MTDIVKEVLRIFELEAKINDNLLKIEELECSKKLMLVSLKFLKTFQTAV